jgi:hypothetical protein
MHDYYIGNAKRQAMITTMVEMANVATCTLKKNYQLSAVSIVCCHTAPGTVGNILPL